MIPSWIRDLGGADPYELLDVSRSADRETIVAAYRRQIRTAHPDVPTGDAERARLLHLARDILLDPLKRADYNRFAEVDTVRITEPETLVEDKSIWDDDDVTVGVKPPVYVTPPIYHQPRPQTPPFQPPYQPPPRQSSPYQAPPNFRPAQPSQFGMGLAALLVSLLCTPVGLILGIVALSGSPRSQSDRVCAWVAICLSAGTLLLCVGLYVFVWGVGAFAQ